MTDIFVHAAIRLHIPLPKIRHAHILCISHIVPSCQNPPYCVAGSSNTPTSAIRKLGGLIFLSNPNRLALPLPPYPRRLFPHHAHRAFRIRIQKGTRNPRPKFQPNISPPVMLKTVTVRRRSSVPRRYHVNVVEGLGAARCSVSRFRCAHRCSSSSITAHFSCTASETVPQRPQPNGRTATTFASIRR